MFHRSRCSLLQSLMLLSLSVSPSQLKLGRKGKERTLRSVAPCGRHVEIGIFDSVISTFFMVLAPLAAACGTARLRSRSKGGNKMCKDSNTVEIRWHGRGGQGAKTACLLLADVCFSSGKQVQGFPEYGPERMGAPITAYNRISDGQNRVHSNIYNPDYVVVVDETLLHSVDVTAGLSEEGAIIINSSKEPAELRKHLGGYKGRVCTVDAEKISIATLGKNFPNTPMLAAAVKVSKVVENDKFLQDMESSFRHKFASKPNVIQGNMEALKMSMEEVKVG